MLYSPKSAGFARFFLRSSYARQVQTVIFIEIALIVAGVSVAYSFWDSICGDSIVTCMREQDLSTGAFFFLAFFRPFVFTPALMFAMMAGNQFGPVAGAFISAISSVISCLGVYVLAKLVGKRLVNPWLRSNLPQTLTFLRSQDWKIVLASRLLPFLPFDLMTFIFGLADFRFKWVVLFTFLGFLPEAYVFAKLGEPDATVLESTIVTLTFIAGFCLLPGFVIEFISRKKGTSLWARLQAMWKEIHQEIRLNNEIVKRHQHDPDKIPVLLLYGFFSSRRSLTVLERILTSRGYEVISFNLGGLLGVFFTRSIVETAQFIDYKLKRQFNRHQFDSIHIVGHSKGGFVALWWLLHLGGWKHCSKLVTLGTPFKGSSLTWLALVTPVGLLFRDMWQMRPGSLFLRTLRKTEIPPDVRIYNLYSNRDRVARGENGVFKTKTAGQSQIIPVPMHHVSHFEFLYRRDVGDALARILGSPWREGKPTGGQDGTESDTVGPTNVGDS